MHSKFAVVVLVVLLVAGSWWWISREPPSGLSEREEAGDSSPERSSGKQSAARQNGVPPSEVARPDSSARIGASLERKDSSDRLYAVNSSDRGASSGVESGVGGEHTEFGNFKRRLASSRAFSRETARGDTIDVDAAGLSPDDVDRLDLDQDNAILAWELERARRRVERAEHHPVKNDLGDGEYPVERGDYRRPEWEFDTVDTNRDGLMAVDEYYSFLVITEKTTLRLDIDGDQRISRDEAGLSNDEFAPLDRDGSGSLKAWEIRRAVAQGALD
jgi:hypothetical protein